MGFRDWLRGLVSRVRKAGAPDQPETPRMAPDTMTVGATQVPENVEQKMREEGMVTGGPFAPGRPLSPFFGYPAEPRQWDYPVGYNIVTRPRASAAKVSFDTLRAIVENYDVARLCIERREDEIRGLDWSIVPDDDAPDQDWSAEIKRVTQFFDKPDGFTPFDSWQQMFLEDVLAFDAGAIYKHRTRGGKLGALEVVDGTTLAPLIDYWGRMPDPPAPAFVQFVQGVPAVWLRKDELIYQPFRATARSPYGLPPIEWLLLTINTDIRWQWHFLMYFTEGTVPDTWMQAPPDMTSPKQIQEFQELYDRVMAGEQGWKHRVKWIPAGAKPIPAKNTQFNPEFPVFLLKKCCAAFKVTPAEIGYTDDVNRATSEMQENIQYRSSIIPLARYLEGIYTRIIREEFGLPLRFQFDLGGEKEDRLKDAQAHEIYVKMGVESIDEVRENVLGLPVDKDRLTPRFIMTSQGPIPVDMIGPAAAHNTGQPLGPAEKSVTAHTAAVDDAGVMAELKRWRENARKRVKAGKPPRWFESDILPQEVAEAVWDKLASARTVEEVDRAFEGPFFW